MIPELYTNLFTDGVLSALVLPLRSQTAFFAMQSFGDYDAQAMQIAAGVAGAGAVIGQLINWSTGKLLFELVKKYNPKIIFPGFYTAATYFRRFGVFVLLLSPFWLFGIFTLIAGVFNVRLRYALPLLAIGQVAFFVDALKLLPA